MEAVKISEQEIINALCMYIADKRQVAPTDVLAELMYDDEYGFSAEVEVNGRTQILIKANLIEALRLWLEERGLDPFAARLQLELHEDEGIIAIATF
ncbi:YxcD family protein [Ectobacillus sp. JY-23]|uniref:YxcD family protein n=1 Tax=Ectobacillus sp. JY-23 TaxID=2933872 RepID=UPI001FF65DA4|nr:YxcD family protein [Ectobacillus sp. JY-23]UOY93032.1 YxcD family protein [Ectobacillus sp. JY-23]